MNMLLAYSIQSPVLSNNPALDAVYASKVESIAYKYCEQYKVPCNVVFGIMMAESGYKLNAINKKSRDYGIMQVSHFHVKRGGCFAKQKLLTDLDCSIKAGIDIFAYFYHSQPTLDEAIARYNCGLRPSCPNWSVVKRYVKRVKRYTK